MAVDIAQLLAFAVKNGASDLHLSAGVPPMIRVDGDNKFEISYADCAEALGWDDFGNDDFEEIMSTHYGRMVVLDDKIIMFANPEDAAEYIDFDLHAVS